MPTTRLKLSTCIESITSSKIIPRNTTCTELFTREDLEFVCKTVKKTFTFYHILKTNAKRMTNHIGQKNVSNHGLSHKLVQLQDLSCTLKFVLD